MNLPRALIFHLILFLSRTTWSATHSTHQGTNIHYYRSKKTFSHLVGIGKGDNVAGIGDVKRYLEHFGYLNNPKDHTYQVNDNFDDSLEHGLLKYQTFFKLNKTGVLDDDTISLMSKPRCGNPDIVNGSDDSWLTSNFSLNFNFFLGKPKRTKKHLFYTLPQDVPGPQQIGIRIAMNEWQPLVPIHFVEIYKSSGLKPDVRVGFFKRDHGDGRPFDGPGHILAHSSGAVGDILHFDSDENWVIGSVPDAYDLPSVARHEIGHILGLDHSNDKSAVMFPRINSGEIKHIGDDDKNGIKALYFG